MELINLTTNTLGGAVTQSGLSPYDLCGGETPQDRHCLPTESQSRQPHTTVSARATAKRRLSQLRFGWNDMSATYRNELPAGSRDVSGYFALQFRAAVNFADTRNPEEMPQDCSVTLTDGDGNFSIVRTSEFSEELFYPPGEIGPVPKVILNTVRIPLTAFTGVNLVDIRSIQFDFDREPEGAFLVSEIAFTNVSLALPATSVELTPDTTYVSRGGPLGLQATVTNHTEKSGTDFFATKVRLPNGKMYPTSGYLFGPVSVPLDPHQSKSGHISHRIPNTAPLGIYRYYGYVGRPGEGFTDEDQFDFEVTATSAAAGSEDWDITIDRKFLE